MSQSSVTEVQQQLEQATKVKFSPEDMRVLNECSKESFYSRCLPFSGVFGAATYAAVKAGYLQPSARFGAFPKVSCAVFFGFLLGKFSYRRICAERLMQLPNSEVGELLRKKFNQPSFNNFERPSNELPFVSITPQEKSEQSNSSLDLDTERPSFAPSDYSIYLTSPDSGNPPSEILSPILPTMTYEDMRKQNRESYTQQRAQPYKLEERTKSATPSAERVTKNEYGDVIN